MTKKYYITCEIAALKKISKRRVQAQLKQDQNSNRKKTHYPGAIKKGRDWLIPLEN